MRKIFLVIPFILALSSCGPVTNLNPPQVTLPDPNPPLEPSITVIPLTISTQMGGAPTNFTATLKNSSSPISWSISPSLGTISSNSGASTTYTPPPSVTSTTTVTLTATSGNLTKTSIITINPILNPNLEISPSLAALTAGSGSQVFISTLKNSSNPISWSISPSLGTISSNSGASTTYTPPPSVTSTTTVTLTATSGNLTKTSSITINPAPAPVPSLPLPPARAFTPDSSVPEWLNLVNYDRALSGQDPVVNNPAYTAGCLAHAKYEVLNQEIEHFEIMGKLGYTPEGDACAQNADLAVSSTTANDFRQIQGWMTGPFHGIGIIRQNLKSVAYAAYQDTSFSHWQSAAALDVLRGLSGNPSGDLAFPAPGAVSNLLTLNLWEYPNPLVTCPGYTQPGAEIMLSIHSRASQSNPTVSLKINGSDVEFCVVTKANYPASVGLDIIEGDGLTIIIPKNPLPSGATVSVSSAENGSTYAWSFKTQ